MLSLGVILVATLNLLGVIQTLNDTPEKMTESVISVGALSIVFLVGVLCFSIQNEKEKINGGS